MRFFIAENQSKPTLLCIADCTFSPAFRWEVSDWSRCGSGCSGERKRKVTCQMDFEWGKILVKTIQFEMLLHNSNGCYLRWMRRNVKK